MKRLSIILGTAMTTVVLSVGVAAAAGQGSSTSGLGGCSAVVTACGSGITESYTEAYVSSIRSYSVSQVNLANIPAACLSKSYKIQLTGAGGAAVDSEMSGRLPTAGTTATITTSDSPDASAVTGISLVIS
ncbi:MAG: hypothetical protein ACJ752_15225 [Gaiellaceae bacterium]